MSTANAILLAGVSGALSAAVAFVVTVWLADREIARWKSRAEVETTARKACQRQHFLDDANQAAAIRILETENNLLHAELETIKHGHYRAHATVTHRVVA